MSLSRVAPVGVVFLLLTAGCAGFINSDTTPRTPYEVPTTQRPNTTEPTTQVVRAPPDVVTVLRDQERNLEATESYTLRFNRTVEVSNESGYFNKIIYRVNRSVGRGVSIRRSLKGQRTGLSTFSVYRGDGVFKSRQTPPLGVNAIFNTLSNPEMAPDNASTILLQNEANRLEGIDIERNGTAILDGETFQRYTARGSDAFPGRAGNITSYRLVVLIDDTGRVRMIDERWSRVSTSGVEYTMRERLYITQIGNTTVQVPQWVELITDMNATPTAQHIDQPKSLDENVEILNTDSMEPRNTRLKVDGQPATGSGRSSGAVSRSPRR